MDAPDPPKEDPAIAAARASEQARAEAGQTTQTQALLAGDTMNLRRRFGALGSLRTLVPTAFNGFGGGIAGGAIQRPTGSSSQQSPGMFRPGPGFRLPF